LEQVQAGPTAEGQADWKEDQQAQGNR